ncbi:MAG: tetratricopeptide repeat protein [Desulfococcaceae bacterium]|jgi:tetratricopeptide (TPR) repeat protein|nr:tetratricopeptide repeat protein [Desulfococcaceae bacterium]
MKADNPAGILEQIRKNSEIEHLAMSMSFAEKSLFAILVSEDILYEDLHQTDFALGVLAEKISVIIGEPVVFLHFAFKKNGLELHENTTFEMLIAGFLKPLYYWSELEPALTIRPLQRDWLGELMPKIRTFEFFPDDAGIPREGICFGHSDLPKTWAEIHQGKLIFALDFSRTGECDKNSLSAFFQRMNEVRDSILRKIPGLFLLILPPFLEIEFSRNAADFWSVYSVVAHLESFETEKLSPETLPRIEVPHLSFFAFGKEEIFERLGKARVEFSNAPDNPWVAKSLIIWLTRLGNYEMEKGSITLAGNAYEESLHIAREFCEQFPNDSDWLKKLCTCLENCGEVYLMLGDNEKYLNTFGECIEIQRSLLKMETEPNAEWQSHLARTLFRRGDFFIDSGDTEKAFSDHRESFERRKSLAEIKPDFPPYLFDLAVSYTRLALFSEEKGDIVSATDTLKKAASILKSLTEQNPGIKDWRNAFDFCTQQLSRLEKKAGKNEYA